MTTETFAERWFPRVMLMLAVLLVVAIFVAAIGITRERRLVRVRDEVSNVTCYYVEHHDGLWCERTP